MNKYLYFRRFNSSDVKDNRYLIIGDEQFISGRDGAYNAKGAIHEDENFCYADIETGKNNDSFPKVFYDIELNDNVKRDYDVHHFIKENCLDLCYWDGECPEGTRNTREGFIINPSFKTQDEVDDAMEDLYYRILNYVNGKLPRIKMPSVYVDKIEEAEKCINAMEKFYSVSDFNNTVFNACCDFCPRFGKTGFAIETVEQLCGCQVLVVAAYVKTVGSSFRKELFSYLEYENWMYVDTSKEFTKEEIENHIIADKNNKVCIFIPLVGDENVFKKRFDKNIQEILKNHLYILSVDEVDYGAHCKKQVNKLKQCVFSKTCLFTLTMTGTNAERAGKIWNIDYYSEVTLLDLYAITN